MGSVVKKSGKRRAKTKNTLYGYIGEDGFVGEVFEELPPLEWYHESFYCRIEPLPEGAGAGWKREGDAWVAPQDAGRAAAEAEARAERKRLLDQCDLVYCNASNWELFDADEKCSWHVYKQALRDVTEQAGFPYDITWPKKPNGVDSL